MLRIFQVCIIVLVYGQMSGQISYPHTNKTDYFDTYFDQRVSDPYHWLEDDMSEETKAWVSTQNKTTFEYLDKIPYRSWMKTKLTDLWNYEKTSAPVRHGHYYYYSKNNGLQKQSVIYRRNRISWREELFIDPNTFSKDGTVSISDMSFSSDGSMLALSLSDGGSDWKTVVIYDVIYKEYVDTIRNVKFSDIAWKGTDTIYYSTYDRDANLTELSTKNQYHKLMRHKVGHPQSDDKLIFGGESHPYRYIRGYFTENENLLIVTAANHTKKNELFLLNANYDHIAPIQITQGIEATCEVLDQFENKLILVTDYQAPNRKVMVANLSNPHHSQWQELIAEKPYPIDFNKGGGYIWAIATENVRNKVSKYDYYGMYHGEVNLPGIGTVGGFGAENKDSILFYTLTNAISPSNIYEYNIKEDKSALYLKSPVKFNADAYVSKQVFYTSKDGTKIPMTITHRKDIVLDGSNPTILYGYGGFNNSLLPTFSTTAIFWVQLGGVYAVANLRGGGEYGNKWHEQGIKMKKQNVFDDFIAAAEYLKSEKYTSTNKLAIMGGSNGGLLVGATMTQRPDLCRVALPAVGVLDMLRYHKFTAGAGWAYDYGRSDDSPEMFRYLLGYSPLHNVKPACYPATMVTTGDHDDRVVPAHSFKYAATLQEKQKCSLPTLIRIDVRAGHGSGKSTEQVINETIDKFAFSLFNMGVKSISEDYKLQY